MRPHHFTLFITIILLFGGVTEKVTAQSNEETDKLDGIQQESSVNAYDFNISVRLLNAERNVVWNSDSLRRAYSGRPLVIKVNSESGYINVSLILHPYVGTNRFRLETVSELLWRNGNEMTYLTSVNLIDGRFNQPTYLYPLGVDGNDDNNNIEIYISINPNQSSIPVSPLTPDGSYSSPDNGAEP